MLVDILIRLIIQAACAKTATLQNIIKNENQKNSPKKIKRNRQHSKNQGRERDRIPWKVQKKQKNLKN